MFRDMLTLLGLHPTDLLPIYGISPGISPRFQKFLQNFLLFFPFFFFWWGGGGDNYPNSKAYRDTPIYQTKLPLLHWISFAWASI